MPRKNRDGKFILSAGEIGSYTLCPEAWRLANLERRTSGPRSDESKMGNKLHDVWAKGHDDVVFLTFGVKLVITLIVGLILWKEILG